MSVHKAHCKACGIATCFRRQSSVSIVACSGGSTDAGALQVVVEVLKLQTDMAGIHVVASEEAAKAAAAYGNFEDICIAVMVQGREGDGRCGVSGSWGHANVGYLAWSRRSNVDENRKAMSVGGRMQAIVGRQVGGHHGFTLPTLLGQQQIGDQWPDWGREQTPRSGRREMERPEQPSQANIGLSLSGALCRALLKA